MPPGTGPSPGQKDEIIRDGASGSRFASGFSTNAAYNLPVIYPPYSPPSPYYHAINPGNAAHPTPKIYHVTRSPPPYPPQFNIQEIRNRVGGEEKYIKEIGKTSIDSRGRPLQLQTGLNGKMFWTRNWR
jgi:hypothetical protein